MNDNGLVIPDDVRITERSSRTGRIIYAEDQDGERFGYCSRCNDLKPLYEFFSTYAANRRNNGHIQYPPCKQCHKNTRRRRQKLIKPETFITSEFLESIVKDVQSRGFTIKRMTHKGRIALAVDSNGNEFKFCYTCNQLLDLNEFKTKTMRKNGRCDRCTKEYYRWYWESLTPEQKKAHSANTNRNGHRYKQSLTGVANSLLQHIRTRSKKFNLETDIDKEWLLKKLEPKRCEVTGAELSFAFSKDHHRIKWNKASIDRIDNDKGYTKDNCQIVCWMYNLVKADHPHQTVLNFAKQLLKHEGYKVTKPPKLKRKTPNKEPIP